MLISRPAARIYLENGNQVAVHGEDGQFWGQEARMEIRGAVQGEDSRGYHLETDRLTYQAASHQIESPGPVKIWSQGLTVRGDRLKGDLAAQKFEIEGQVRTEATGLKWGGG